MKKKKQTSKMLTGIQKASTYMLAAGTLIITNIQPGKGQWNPIPPMSAGRTNLPVQKIGIGAFPTNASVLAKLHINQFLLAPNPPTNGLLFRTDGNSTQDNMWQFFTGTSATNQTEKFRLFIPANSNNVFLRASQIGANMQFQTTGLFIGGITRLTITDGLFNGYIGIGENFTTPQSRLHQHEVVPATDNFHQFTNVNTGNSATDGAKIGIDAGGEASYNQFETKAHIWRMPQSGGTPALQEWMRLQHGNITNANLGGNVTNGFLGLNDPNPFFHVSINSPAFTGGELFLGAHPSDVPNSYIGFCNVTFQNSRFLPTTFGTLDNTQPLPAFQTLANIDGAQDLAPGTNNFPVHRFVVGKNWKFNQVGIQDIDTIVNRIAFTWQNANVIKMMMNAQGQLRIGAALNIPATLPNNRVEITASVNDPYNSVIPVNGASGLRFTHLTSLKTPLNNGVNGIDTTKVLSVDQNGDVVLVRAGGGGGGMFLPCSQGGGNLTANSLLNMNGNSIAFSGAGDIYIGDVLACNTLPANIARVFIRNTFGAPPNPTVGLWVESNNGISGEIALVSQNPNPGSLAAQFIGDVDITGQLTVNGTPVTSDQMFKININNIPNATNLLMHLNPISFNYDTATYKNYGFQFTANKRYGLIAQQVENYLPELVEIKTKKQLVDINNNSVIQPLSYKTLDYTSLIAILIKGFQEQQQQIEYQDSLIQSLSSMIQSCCANNGSKLNANTTHISLSDEDAIILNQNVPNPFAESTTITYHIPDQYTSAQIIFTTMDGRVIKKVDVSNKKTHGTLQVYAPDLSSGIYVYYLVVDGKTIETKKMTKE